MALLHGSKVKLFALSANKELGEKVAKYIGLPLSECKTVNFADGEIMVDIFETVRGHDVFVIQPTSNPVSEHYMELLIMIDALKRASARTINIVMPYYGYSRQDRKARAREPISAKLMADLLESIGSTRVLTMDLHAAQIQGFFDIPIDNFEALPIFVQYFKRKKMEEKNIVVVSPDHGGVTRARKFALYFNAPIAIIDKRRPKPNVAEVMNIIGEVAGKHVIIIDDIVDTAGTISIASTALIKAGAIDVYVACTHPILSGNAIPNINNSDIKELVTTDSIYLPEEKRSPKITQLTIAKILGRGILNIIDGKSVSDLFVYEPTQNYYD
ncbi:MAG: ribose-phosphate pyrophosphokinase [Bacilli bacterium]